jgi:AAA family ATP:ADP antiporter
LRHPSGAVLPLLGDLHHQDTGTRIAAIELLDNMLHPAMKRIVNPVLETAVMDKTTPDILLRLDMKAMDAATCLEHMLKADDDHLKLGALAVIDALDRPEFDYLVQMAAGDPHAHVRHAAERMMHDD